MAQYRKFLLRLPEALYIDIADEALRRETTITREMIRRLQLKRWSNQAMRELGYRKPSRATEDPDGPVEWLNPDHSWFTRG